MLPEFRMIDLSVPLEHRAVSEPLPAQIRYIRHDGEGLQQMQQFFGVRPEDLVYSNGLGWAVEEVQAITHTGTHVDAPYHYGPTSEGKPARTIDHVPLEWCFAPGVVLDVRHKAAGEVITVDDLEAALVRIDYQLRPLDIILLHTGADKRLGSPDYFAQPGLGREGVLWLVEQGVKVIGIDAYTLDRPFKDMVADFKRTGDGRHIWPAHFAGIEQRILPDREIGQPGPDSPAARLLRFLLAGQDPGCQCRVVPGRCDGARGNGRLFIALR